MRELQLFSLEILKDVHRFCVEKHILYSVSDGSLIGCIRHGGFIPWDDDIDIIMPRPEYERFCKEYQSDRFMLKCREKDKDCLVPFARVFDVEKTIIETSAPWCKGNVGVWIDVFPADSVIEDEAEYSRYYDESRKLWLRSGSARSAYSGYIWNKPLVYNIKLLIKKIVYFNGKRSDYYVREVMRRAKAIDYGKTKFWGNLSSMGDNIKEHHRLEIFEGYELKKFEDTEVMVMNGYDEYLHDKYNDYMQLPPIEKRVAHYSERTKFYWR